MIKHHTDSFSSDIEQEAFIRKKKKGIFPKFTVPSVIKLVKLAPP